MFCVGFIFTAFNLPPFSRSPPPQVKAILDWELSTIGNPWADVAYNCLPYYLPQGKWGRAGVWPWGDHRQTHNCLPYYLPQSQRGRSGV